MDAHDGGPAYALVDGGVFANNPGMAAWVDAHEGARPDQKVFMVSLGTGSPEDPITYQTAPGCGKILPAQPIIGRIPAFAPAPVHSTPHRAQQSAASTHSPAQYSH